MSIDKRFGSGKDFDRMGRPIRRLPVAERLFNKTERAGECLVFTGSLTPTGYGHINALGQSLAHRVAWILANGPIPDGLVVCHRCDNPRCVLVDHLFLGTMADNTQDMMNKGRLKRSIGVKNGKTKFDDEMIRAVRAEAEAGQMLRVVARQFGISPSYVSRLTRNCRRQHVA